MNAKLLAIALISMSATSVWAKAPTAQYKCDDGTKVVATFQNKTGGLGSVSLYFPKTGKRMSLPQGMSADGGRYAAGKAQFWIKGDQATFTRAGRDTVCHTNS